MKLAGLAQMHDEMAGLVHSEETNKNENPRGNTGALPGHARKVHGLSSGHTPDAEKMRTAKPLRGKESTHCRGAEDAPLWQTSLLE